MKIKGSVIESTPFAEIHILDKVEGGKCIAWCKMYWTQNSGVYGYQVCYQGNIETEENGYFEGKTTGCGYCKKSAALSAFLTKLNGKPKNIGGDVDYYLHKYRKGNYYGLTLRQLNAAIK